MVFLENAYDNVTFAVISNFNLVIQRLTTYYRLLLLVNFLRKYKLVLCDDLDNNKLSYTYRHVGLTIMSLNDHVFIFSLVKDSLRNYYNTALDSRLNFSDYYVICFVCSNLLVIKFMEMIKKIFILVLIFVLGMLGNCNNVSGHYLSEVQIPHALKNFSYSCTHSDHIYATENFTNRIVKFLLNRIVKITKRWARNSFGDLNCQG